MAPAAGVAGELTIRRADHDDLAAIVSLAGVALGWDDGPNDELFRWKHLENPFGPSPMWLAESDGRLAGFRCFLRWELTDPSGARLRAVRAVDTATHPDFQRRGIFTSLTMAAIEAETAAGTDLVFNTPNSQSRPGYLKMGWSEVGRLRTTARPRSLGAVAKMASAKVPAEKWSLPCGVGAPAEDALASRSLERLCASVALADGLATPRRPEVLRWRYRLSCLNYRVLQLGADVADGIGIFRLRRRGQAVECVVADIIVPGNSPGAEAAIVVKLARSVRADYLLRLGNSPCRGFVPVPGAGPILTARALNTIPPITTDAWAFSLGDIELF
jgi:GNAT superfamily N-acetyltransferase